jgi:hypothetical protein
VGYNIKGKRGRKMVDIEEMRESWDKRDDIY